VATSACVNIKQLAAICLISSDSSSNIKDAIALIIQLDSCSHIYPIIMCRIFLKQQLIVWSVRGNHWSLRGSRWRFLWRKMRSCWTVWMHARFSQISLQKHVWFFKRCRHVMVDYRYVRIHTLQKTLIHIYFMSSAIPRSCEVWSPSVTFILHACINLACSLSSDTWEANKDKDNCCHITWKILALCKEIMFVGLMCCCSVNKKQLCLICTPSKDANR